MIDKKQLTHVMSGGIQMCQLYSAPLHTPNLWVAIYILYAMYFWG